MTQTMERPIVVAGEMPHNVTTVDVKTLRKYLDQFERRDDILRGLGIVGWDTYERAVEAFLLVGGSILLVGSHGEGKTMLAKKLGAALGVPMAKYDASKNVWEDIIGFPDPARLMTLENRGKTIGIPRIETPTSIWGKRLVLVDEINRATPEMQSKWLEVILDQTLMGEQTGAKWIISAMNPGYAGTNPLDLALVSRYMFFIQAPLGVRMPSEDLMEVLSLENPEETPAFMTWRERRIRKAAPDIPPGVEVSDAYIQVSEETIRKFIEASNKLKAVMIIAADSYTDIATRWGSSVDEYIVSVVKTILNEAKFPTDVRRIRMIKNAILSSIALEGPVRGLSSKNVSSMAVQELALQVLYMSYPVVAGIEGPERAQLQAAHLKAQDLLEDRSSPIFKISMESDPVKKLILLFQYEDREPILTYKIIGDALKSDGGFAAYCTAYALLAAHREGLPLDTQGLTIVSTSISKMLTDMSKKSATVGIKEKQDQMMLWNLYKFLKKDTFVEAAAAQIAYYQVLDSKAKAKNSGGNQFASVGGLVQDLDKVYKQVLPKLQDTYNQIKSIIPEAQKTSSEVYTEEETEEAWEAAEE